MSHTPGPWTEHEGFIIGRFNSDNEIHDICDPRCAPADADTICEMDANARLIAAAPELLEALINIANRMGQMNLDYELPEDCGGIVCGELDAANIVISKATGGL